VNATLSVSEWIEMKIAIMMLSFVMSWPQADRARVAATKACLRLMENAVKQFHLDTGRLPTAAEGLSVLINRPADVRNWAEGGYLDTAELPNDAWGRELLYILDPNLPDGVGVYSFGRDGVTSSRGDDADDLSTWNLQASFRAYPPNPHAARNAMIHRVMSLAIVLLILAAVVLIIMKGFGRESGKKAAKRG